MGEKQARFCHICGNKLYGHYLVYSNGLTVCDRCEQTVPHCNHCKLPSLQLTQVRGVPICPACLNKLPVCASCERPILSRFFIIGDSPLRYCEDCYTTQPRCDICRVPLNAQGRIIKHQNSTTYRCHTCFETAITNFAEAEQLYRETAGILHQQLSLTVPQLPRLHIVSRDQLINLHNSQQNALATADAPAGEQQHLLGYFQRHNQDFNIYIEQFLPRTLFQAVAAHELAHAWQSVNAVQNQSLKILEGFAEWVAYKTLLSLGYQRDAARLTRRNDLYGEGLQYFIALERQQGRQQVLQRARI